MILEAAPLKIRKGQSAEFEQAFSEAQSIIAASPGYISHELQRCVEHEDEYLLLVRWETLAAHEMGFRESDDYENWRALLHHFYDPFPTVLHYEKITSASEDGM